MKPLFVLAAAEADIQAAMRWYDRIAPGLSDGFLSRLQSAMLMIREHPELYELEFDEVRAAPLWRFPYLAYYHILPEGIELVGVLHAQLDPQQIARQISSRNQLA